MSVVWAVWIPEVMLVAMSCKSKQTVQYTELQVLLKISDHARTANHHLLSPPDLDVASLAAGSV